MNLFKSTRWMAIAIGLLSGPALAATSCLITPAYSIITEGQSLQLTAVCTGDQLTSIDWKMDAVSVTGSVSLTDYVAGEPIKYTTPVGLGDAKETQEFVFTVGGGPATVDTTSARVVVKPSSAVLALAKIGSTANTNKTPGACGTADGSAVTAMPTGTAQCATGSVVALPISGPQSFTWSCLSLTGGAEASCYAMRGYTVTATAGTNGSISPATQGVTSGGTASVSATPATGYSAVISGCGGTQSGNNFTTGPVTANCTVTANFTNAPVTGTCGSAAGVTTTSAPSANLCTTGSASAVSTATASYGWSCAGANGGTTASCTAPHAFTVSTTAGANGSISPSKDVVGNTSTTFTVAPATGYAASVSGCGGSLSGGTYTTGPITAACTVTASFAQQTVSLTDPGSGLWVPPNTTNRVIADQSGPTAAYLSSYIPGCLNGSYITSSWNTGCGANSSFTGTVSGTSTTTTFAFGAERVLGLRYMSKSTAGTTLRYFTLASADGGNTGTMSVWLSDSPTATYAETSSACKSTSTSQPYVITGPGYCPIVANKRYYLFMSTARTDAGLRYLVNEGSADFY
ncbi:MAG: InlB B-repeat-containing protein [Thiobacillus sp.]